MTVCACVPAAASLDRLSAGSLLRLCNLAIPWLVEPDSWILVALARPCHRHKGADRRVAWVRNPSALHINCTEYEQEEIDWRSAQARIHGTVGSLPRPIYAGAALRVSWKRSCKSGTSKPSSGVAGGSSAYRRDLLAHWPQPDAEPYSYGVSRCWAILGIFRDSRTTISVQRS